MISIIIMCFICSVPIDYYFEPYKEKEVPMAVNRKDKRSKNFVIKVSEWNKEHGVEV